MGRRETKNAPSSNFFTSYLMPSNRLRRESFLRFSRPNAVESSFENLREWGWREEGAGERVK